MNHPKPQRLQTLPTRSLRSCQPLTDERFSATRPSRTRNPFTPRTCPMAQV